MKWMFTYLVAGGLGLIAWQTLDTPNPVLDYSVDEFAQFSMLRPYEGQNVNVGWSGNTARRDEILMSAVWLDQRTR